VCLYMGPPSILDPVHHVFSYISPCHPRLVKKEVFLLRVSTTSLYMGRLKFAESNSSPTFFYQSVPHFLLRVSQWAACTRYHDQCAAARSEAAARKAGQTGISIGKVASCVVWLCIFVQVCVFCKSSCNPLYKVVSSCFPRFVC